MKPLETRGADLSERAFSEVRTVITKDEAVRLIQDSSKYAHALVVAAVLRALADRLGEDAATWELVGLLHDLDVDIVAGDMSHHGVLASQMLQGRLPDDGLSAIKCHDHRTGFQPRSRLDHALRVVDALVTSLEPRLNQIASITDIHDAIEETSQQKPWVRPLIERYSELGLTRTELFHLTLHCL